MGKEEFEQRLTQFFQEYDQKKLRLVPRIINELGDHEELIMNHLHKKYNTGYARNVSEEELMEEDRKKRQEERGEPVSEEALKEEEAPTEEENPEEETVSSEEGSEEDDENK